MTRQGVLVAAASHEVAPTGLAPQIRSTWPTFSEDEIAEVTAVLRSGRVNALHHGERCRAFEAAFARRCAMPFAIAVANGTLALELALRALEIGAGHEVIVPARSFVASASAVVNVGATPVFADVDADSQTLTAATVAAVLTARTRAILPVHLAGWPAPADELADLARVHGLRIIEDCAQAHGASWGNRPVGSLGDAAAFSFCTDKIMSTGGEGGMLLLRDRSAWERAWAYKDHGKLPAAPKIIAPAGTFRWLHDSIGSNYRLTEMQAAIGLSQLTRLDSWLAARRRNAAILDRSFQSLVAIRVTVPPPWVEHAYYKYYVFLRPERLRSGWTRDRILARLIDAGVPCGSGSCPEIYRERAFAQSPFALADALPVARRLGETSLMLPVDPTLDEAAVEAMAGIVVSTILGATRR